jgi:hypothetical protein
MRCAYAETTGKVPCREGIRNVSAREGPYAEEDGTELNQPDLTTAPFLARSENLSASAGVTN